MMRKVLSAARALGYWTGIAGQRERSEGVARILVFHGTLRQDAAELERQLRYVRRHFRVAPLAEVIAQNACNLARTVAITFDDGLRNNVTVAYPILRRLGLPATFFVCPGLIDRGQWLWTHEVRRRLHHGGAGLRRELAARYGIGNDAEDLVQWMKSLELASRNAVEATLREATASWRPSAAERHAYDLACWDELRGLDPSIVTIGSHTLTHPILPCVSAAQCEFELRESKRRIEEQLERPVELFAYPNDDHTPLVRQLAARYYRAALAGTGTGHAASDAFALPRIAAPRGALRLAAAMHRPAPRPALRRLVKLAWR
jgi:peptidoglycan/xylan/chitin deacetylase (PgdA/CDA1 family)